MEIRLATETSELEAVYRFRYAIYVEEMQRTQKYADHRGKRICDPLDHGSHVLGAWEGDELVGTLRCNFLRDTSFGEYYEMYHIDRLPEHVQKRTSITTRLMIHQRFRKGTLGVRLSKAIYSIALERGITTDLIDCNGHLVPFSRDWAIGCTATTWFIPNTARSRC
ncbi:MAG: GNAT family N-acetyltransferase [Planctomycetota bacterium]|nr:GNAT family N-acetyltransferase [Planctomycetota bacterium]